MPLSSLREPPTPTLYPLSLHDALPISTGGPTRPQAVTRARRATSARARAPLIRRRAAGRRRGPPEPRPAARDRKSTRLNSSHVEISYAVFCLKKKKENIQVRKPE